ncbi:pilus assembly protein N-terminal domain-containing protein [Bradyrhizobium sp. U87765 SZCCT0134]|uniref:pilus assembly protein N-terminal domain-containing protein n=1 Tax=unclassified Bradyrhizobium TaxID=2631580 RepID=UPI001BAA905D|nr:pilus assembly protein N-terminal domain-containing protein [Bradyrhizobium sp. U87765 SZCCT0134]MBR1305816.1 pilus assembly protein N-terminal domain-containing protein [Bradyrhizobium sp. U87765 SZCCT0110]MBR1322183.1 pilus assembly protein N-terminal domain-containing protein [Bradyrhizobium sp. U87765 SZCCT0109]
MPRFVPQWTSASLIAAAMLSPAIDRACAIDAPPVVRVAVNEAKLVDLPSGTRRIILGAPLVVRAQRLSDGRHAVLTGTAFGETNMVVLDGAGVVLQEQRVRVDAQVGAGPVVQRGSERMTYSCTDQCQPLLQLGDGAPSKDIGSQILSRSNGAAGASAVAKDNRNKITGKDGAL